MSASNRNIICTPHIPQCTFHGQTLDTPLCCITLPGEDFCSLLWPSLNIPVDHLTNLKQTSIYNNIRCMDSKHNHLTAILAWNWGLYLPDTLNRGGIFWLVDIIYDGRLLWQGTVIIDEKYNWKLIIIDEKYNEVLLIYCLLKEILDNFKMACRKRKRCCFNSARMCCNAKIS